EREVANEPPLDPEELELARLARTVEKPVAPEIAAVSERARSIGRAISAAAQTAIGRAVAAADTLYERVAGGPANFGPASFAAGSGPTSASSSSRSTTGGTDKVVVAPVT